MRESNKQLDTASDLYLDSLADKFFSIPYYFKLSIEQRSYISDYLNDHANPKWKSIIIRDDGTTCQISNVGSIQDSKGNKLKKYVGSSGYEMSWVRSYKDPKTCYPVMIHRLVAEAFIPNPDNKPEVNHVNTDKAENWYRNLEWVTHQENIQHSIKLGHQVVGEDHKNSKFTEEQIRKVCKMLEDPDAIIRDISKATGVSIKTINHIRLDSGWKHISKDYNIAIPKLSSGPRYSKLSIAIRDMISAGYSNDKIRSELNLSGLSSGISSKTISDRIWYIRNKMV